MANEQERLAELEAKKKSTKLDDKEFQEYKTLKKKFGNFKRGSGNHGSSFRPGNDYSWWSKYPELIRDCANLKSNWIAGTQLAGSDLPFTPPGVVRIEYIPTYGTNHSAVDPLNVWARDLYLRMFQKWRGISAYSASDLAITLIASLEFVRAVAKAERIYGVINRYSKRNVNMPHAEEAALGLSSSAADYIRNHLSDYRYDLNVLIKKAQRLCIPKDISLIQNMISLSGYEYLDHDNAKAQIILFDYDLYGKYDETSLTTGGCVIFEESPTFVNVSDPTKSMLDNLATMLDALVGSDSVQKIFGDLVTWFGEDQLLTILPIPEDYVVVPVYSESILHKIHNMEAIPQGYGLKPDLMFGMDAADVAAIQGMSNTTGVIYQFNDAVVTQGTLVSISSSISWAAATATKAGFAVTQGYFDGHIAGAHIIDTYRVDPTDETVVEGVLFKFAGTRDSVTLAGQTYTGIHVTACAFELIKAVNLYNILPNGTIGTYLTGVNIANNNMAAYQFAAKCAMLDWAPLSYYVNLSFIVQEVLGDIDTPIPVYANDIQRLHTTCIYSGLRTDVTVTVGR